MIASLSKNLAPLSQEDLNLINQFTRRPLSQDEVYSFSLVLCDNEVDRHWERFSVPALNALASLFLGKTGIFDHQHCAQNQAARIFATSLESDPGRLTQQGEPYTRLVAKAYLPRSPKLQDLILEIDSGIKKEVSVGCAVAHRFCSICGKDRLDDPCEHQKGESYPVDGKMALCYDLLDSPTDAYEWSFVAVPAQRNAGVIKSFSQNHSPVDIQKSLEDLCGQLDDPSQEAALSKDALLQLLDYISQLDRLADLGRSYRKELVQQSLKFSAVVQPLLPAEVLKRALDSMPIDDLIGFRDAYQAKAASVLPLHSQFSPDAPAQPPDDFHSFQI